MVRPQIVIIGGSFAGLSCAQHLYKHANNDISIHLVEPSNYFEYNPSNVHSIVDPLSHQHVMIHMEQLGLNGRADPARYSRYQTAVVAITDTNVKLRDGRVLPYDYLVIAIGSGYANKLKPENAFSASERQSEIVSKHLELEQCAHVTIVGAGLLGVELAAEIAVKYGTSKQCRLITRNDLILPILPERAQSYARKFLTQHHVVIEDGLGKTPQQFIAEAQADELVFDCTGITPATFPRFELGSGSQHLNTESRTGFMKVNEYLQLMPRIFCIGDCSNDPNGSAKLAYTAELHGDIAARNILALVRGGHTSELHAFPRSLSKMLPAPSVICCSLGPRDGVLCFNNLAMTGYLAAGMKWFIERSKVGQYRGNWFAQLIWRVGEPATFYLNILYQSIAASSNALHNRLHAHRQRQR